MLLGSMSAATSKLSLWLSFANQNYLQSHQRTKNSMTLILQLWKGFVGMVLQQNLRLFDYYFDFKRQSQMGCLSSTPTKEKQSYQKTEKVIDKLRETMLTNTSHKQQFIFTPFQANYTILKQAINDNSKLKLIQQNSTKEQFILKYLKGDAKYIKTITPMINEYSKLSFAYLTPLLQHQVYSKEAQMHLRIPYYPHLLEEFKNDKFHKCDKLIVFYRIVRAVSYLQKNGILHNKIQLGNIFFKNKDNRCIFLGLPSWTSPKKQEKQNVRVIHIKALSKIFKALFPQPQLDESMNKLIQQMDDVADNQLTINTILQTVLSFNFLDSIETVQQNKKTIIDYEQGDHYEGEVDQNKNKQGYGVMTQSQTKYWGHWTNNVRSNRGNFECTQYVYVGQWKENKRQGFGLIIQTKVREYYEGYFTNGQKDKFGIWQGTNGQIYIGNWNMNQREGYGIYYDGNGEFYYEGEWKGDKKNGKGKQVYRNGQSYEGEYKDNIKDGRGHYIHPSVFDYQGEFKDNLITGHGTFVDKDRNTYVGTLINGVYQGRGKISNKDGSYFYEGEWENGARHGEGQQKTKDSHYIGRFVKNRKDGKGVLKELNQTYTGQFKMGKVTGFGEYLYENGDKYIGNFIDKLKDGKGIYTSAKDGSVYEGFWLQDRKQGQGKHTLKNGEYYDGEWFYSQRSGYGVQYINEENRYQGYWKKNKKQGKGIQYQAGNRYEGQFKNGMKHSKFATLVFTNGDVYQGSFVDNKQQGEGKYTWSNGDQYIGGFVANNREGQGIMKFKQSGFSYQGGWKNDLREGHGIEKYKDGEFVGEFANNKKNGKGVRTFIDSDGVGKLVGTWANDLKHGEFQFFFPDNTSERREYSNDIDRITLCMTVVPY